MNAKLLASLEIVIELWMNDNCEEDWWYDSAGFISHKCSARLAQVCALVLEESKSAQVLAAK